MTYLLVSIIILTYPVARVIAGGIIRANEDIFLGVYMPKNPQRVDEQFLVFKTEDQKRIEALEFVFRRLFKREGVESKWVVQVKNTLKDYKLVVPSHEVLVR